MDIFIHLILSMGYRIYRYDPILIKNGINYHISFGHQMRTGIHAFFTNVSPMSNLGT